MPFDHFNLIAGFYDRAGQFIVTDQLLQWLALPPDCFLLDAGGGTGRLAAALSMWVGKVVVADLSLGMLRQARNKSLVSVCTPAEHLPFQSATIDRIIMVDALHHVFDQKLTADELWRVLVPGGRILIIEPDIHQFAIRLLAIGEKIILMRSHFLSHERITTLFRGSNAHVEVFNRKQDVIILVEKVRQM